MLNQNYKHSMYKQYVFLLCIFSLAPMKNFYGSATI